MTSEDYSKVLLGRFGTAGCRLASVLVGACSLPTLPVPQMGMFDFGRIKQLPTPAQRSAPLGPLGSLEGATNGATPSLFPFFFFPVLALSFSSTTYSHVKPDAHLIDAHTLIVIPFQ